MLYQQLDAKNNWSKIWKWNEDNWNASWKNNMKNEWQELEEYHEANIHSNFPIVALR